ncbi:MAG: pilus assembly protein [Nitrospirae bacterium]|nr:pilus assembly protein [Nitrospirota bacterium]
MRTKFMLNDKNEKGQTVIETALMMILLLVLIFGIAEIARAWWLKNQLNNAARVGVRVAIVTPGLTLIAAPGKSCSWTTTCTASSTNEAVIKACASITNRDLCDGGGNAANAARVTVELVLPDIPPTGVSSGDTIKVTVTGRFVSVVPNLATLSFGLIPDQIKMQTSASMRYE